MRRRRRKLLFLLTFLLLLIGLPAWWLNREIQHEQDNNSLMAAIRSNDMKAALEALERGADANARDLGDEKPSLRERLYQLLERLCGRTVPDRNADRPTALLVLLDWTLDPNDQVSRPSEYERVVQVLLERGANPNVTDEAGKTPLHGACLWNSPASVRLLLHRGAQVMAKDQQERIPLHYAASHSEIITNLLLQAGADIEAKDYFGDTPLHMAARVGKLETVRLLVTKGASVNKKGYLDMTPLHYATSHNRLEVTRFLLEHHADVNAKSYNGETPLASTHLYDNRGLLRLLKQYGAK